MIYFAKTKTLIPPLVKIGFVRKEEDVWERIRTLSTSCPDDLEVIGIMEGWRIREREIHEYFSKFHKRREWFFYDETMIPFIVKYRTHDTQIA